MSIRDFRACEVSIEGVRKGVLVAAEVDQTLLNKSKPRMMNVGSRRLKLLRGAGQEDEP